MYCGGNKKGQNTLETRYCWEAYFNYCLYLSCPDLTTLVIIIIQSSNSRNTCSFSY